MICTRRIKGVVIRHDALLLFLPLSLPCATSLVLLLSILLCMSPGTDTNSYVYDFYLFSVFYFTLLPASRRGSKPGAGLCCMIHVMFMFLRKCYIYVTGAVDVAYAVALISARDGMVKRMHRKEFLLNRMVVWRSVAWRACHACQFVVCRGPVLKPFTVNAVQFVSRDERSRSSSGAIRGDRGGFDACYIGSGPPPPPAGLALVRFQYIRLRSFRSRMLKSIIILL